VANYIDLDGVQTWYDKTGAGEPLVLLHPGGGGVDSRAFGPNIRALAAHFSTFAPERRGSLPRRAPSGPSSRCVDLRSADENRGGVRERR
jgi:pimeloyl-ACP methyl ester carboxylesterase